MGHSRKYRWLEVRNRRIFRYGTRYASNDRMLEGYYLRPGASNDVLAVDSVYASRFMEKYRISFNWLSGSGIQSLWKLERIFRMLFLLSLGC